MHMAPIRVVRPRSSGDGPGRTGVLLQHRRADAHVGHRAQGTDTPSTNLRAQTLFEPLGIAASEWIGSRGIPTPEGDCACDRATWQRSASLSLRAAAGTAAKSCRRHGSTRRRHRDRRPRDNNPYGYLWWLGRSPFDGREVHWAAALGRGGQSIRIVPELDLVVVVTAGYYQDYSPRAFQVQSGVFRDVLRGSPPPG